MPSPRPGARAPHAWLAEGSSTLDLFGRSFVLLQQDDRKGLAAVREVDGHSLLIAGEAGVKLVAEPHR